jgi:hypothetical protein
MLFLVLCPVLWLLRQHAARIVSLMMAAALAVSLLPSRSRATSSVLASTGLPAPAAAVEGAGPLIVHLVLDEYIGPEGLPEELAPAGFKQQFQRFFLERGFRLFGKAYSEYSATLWSVSQLLNFAPGEFVSGLIGPGPNEGTYRLTRNAYFEHLLRLGYSIRVHQADYLYVCPDGMPASCVTHPTKSLDMLGRLDLPVRARMSIVAGTFLRLSEAYSRAKDKYPNVRHRILAKGVPLPAWNWEQRPPAPAGTMPMFDAVAADLSKARRGTFVYAHLLMPHFPYVYDANCRQRPMREWRMRSDPDRTDVPGGMTNVPEGRAERYAMYFQQMLCTQQKIDRMLQAIPPALRQDAIVIMQGDHGSRISLVDPMIHVPASRLASSDYADHFSTLFAVRSPSLGAGYDSRMTPITCLLRTFAQSDFQSTDGMESCATPRRVYFHGRGVPQPHPLPDFWAAGQASRVTLR